MNGIVHFNLVSPLEEAKRPGKFSEMNLANALTRA
jgi:hypothetical protein